MKNKEEKTNVMRILDKNKIKYEAVYYECEKFIDGIHSADAKKIPHELSFKTLVAIGKSKNYYVFVIPIENELDLKKAAKAVLEKSVELIPVKDITKITGYIRGGCSPIGMKKQYKTVIHLSANNYNEIYISGGKIGVTIKIGVEDLKIISKGIIENIIE